MVIVQVCAKSYDILVILCNRFDCISEKVSINLLNVLQADQSYLGTKLSLLLFLLYCLLKIEFQK